MSSRPHALYLEPFHGGSHARFGEALTQAGATSLRWTLLTLPARHWKWRMRGSAAWFADQLKQRSFDLVFASSYVPLAELLGLCPQLARVPTVLYFHENQLAYPNREEAERDHHFGFTQLVSGLAATRLVFNSEFNRRSFFEAGVELLRRMPDAVRPGWVPELHDRSCVLPLPLVFDDEPVSSSSSPNELGPLVLWNHRWEHDKGPDELLQICRGLSARDVQFRWALCGQSYGRVPHELTQLSELLGERLVWSGHAPRDRYRELLRSADVVLSTARHEFFGVSVLEGVHAGARPVVPDRLVYPEIFPAEFRYDGPAHAVEMLTRLAQRPDLRANRRELTEGFVAQRVLPRYDELFRTLLSGPARRS